MKSLIPALFLTLLATPALAQEIPRQPVDEALRARLPPELRITGELVSVHSGSFPPYEIVGDDRSLTGATADLAQAVGQTLGLRVRHEIVSGLSATLGGMKSGRYQIAFGPIGDFPEREAANDFVDWVQEFVVFAVLAGNPARITNLDSTCGKRIAVMAAGSAERVIKAQAEACEKASKPVLEVQSYPDQPTSVLAVRSRRADAFFSSQAPLTYFIAQSKGQLELAAVGQGNGFSNLYQGSVLPKGSPFAPVLLDTYRTLLANGTYAAIMRKWGLDGNMLPQPGINLSGK